VTKEAAALQSARLAILKKKRVFLLFEMKCLRKIADPTREEITFRFGIHFCSIFYLK